MKKMWVLFAVATLALAMMSACIERREYHAPESDLNRLVRFMSGSFSSQAQSLADSSFFDIRLEMVPIWPEREDGHWLYVEQAAANYLEQPYRQRVYRVSRVDDTTFESAVFTLEDPGRFVGAWRTPEMFESLTPDSLTVRQGCSIFLKTQGDTAFVGSTVEDNCESSLRGATYATSEVVIGETKLESWDRGWDSTGTQVWGAEKAGYRFKKLGEE